MKSLAECYDGTSCMLGGCERAVEAVVRELSAHLHECVLVAMCFGGANDVVVEERLEVVVLGAGIAT